MLIKNNQRNLILTVTYLSQLVLLIIKHYSLQVNSIKLRRKEL